MYEYSTTGKAIVESSHPLFPYVRFKVLRSQENWESEDSVACRWRNLSITRDTACKESTQETLSVKPFQETKQIWTFDQNNNLNIEKTEVKRDDIIVKPSVPDPRADPNVTYFVPYPGAPFEHWKTFQQVKAEGNLPTLRFKPRTLRPNPNHRWW